MIPHPVDNNVYCDGVRPQYFWDSLIYNNFHDVWRIIGIEEAMLHEYHDEEGNFNNRMLSEDIVNVPTPREDFMGFN